MNKSTHIIHNLFFVFLGIIFYLVQLDCAFARELDFASSPNPVGSGARALGMGGAFIAVADDATAASWNPGGLVQLKTPEISVVGNWFHRTEDIDFANHPEACGSQSVSKEDLNYISIAYPFNLFNRNMVVSLNYQKLYDFAREWDFQRTTDETTDKIGNLSFPGLPPMIIHTTVHTNTKEKWYYEQSGGLSALGIAYSIQIVPQLSFGLTLNIWDNDLTPNKWEAITHYTGSSTVEYDGISMPPLSEEIKDKNKNEYSFNGLNINIGILWQITDNLTTGFVLKTPFTADIKRKYYSIDQNQPNQCTYDEKLDMPMSCGIGLLYKISDEVRLSADVYRTEWQDYIYTESDGKISPITNKSKDESDIDPTYQVRFGMEYLLVNPKSYYVIPLRAGVFYDPVPAKTSPDDYYGLSLGSGFSMARYAFDIAYQYKFGNDVGSSLTQGATNQNVEKHMVYSSLIIYF